MSSTKNNIYKAKEEALTTLKIQKIPRPSHTTKETFP
jgi:hypothetical protein